MARKNIVHIRHIQYTQKTVQMSRENMEENRRCGDYDLSNCTALSTDILEILAYPDIRDSFCDRQQANLSLDQGINCGDNLGNGSPESRQFTDNQRIRGSLGQLS